MRKCYDAFGKPVIQKRIEGRQPRDNGLHTTVRVDDCYITLEAVTEEN